MHSAHGEFEDPAHPLFGGAGHSNRAPNIGTHSVRACASVSDRSVAAPSRHLHFPTTYAMEPPEVNTHL